MLLLLLHPLQGKSQQIPGAWQAKVSATSCSSPAGQAPATPPLQAVLLHLTTYTYPSSPISSDILQYLLVYPSDITQLLDTALVALYSFTLWYSTP